MYVPTQGHSSINKLNTHLVDIDVDRLEVIQIKKLKACQAMY